jgi:hypothetical protein
LNNARFAGAKIKGGIKMTETNWWKANFFLDIRFHDGVCIDSQLLEYIYTNFKDDMSHVNLAQDVHPSVMEFLSKKKLKEKVIVD